MIKHLSVLPLFACLLLNAACGDEVSKKSSSLSSESSAARDPEAGGSSSSTTTPKGAFELKLDSLVSQNAPWGDIQISVENARLLRGDKPAGFPSSEKHSKDSIYAILDVKLDSNAKDENDYTERKTWDLVLAGDKRVEPLNALGITLAADETRTVSLFYKVEENTSLKGAALEINGSDRSKLEPMKIPLDSRTDFESQVKLPELVGEQFDADGDGTFNFEIVNALYGVNLESTGRRADRDHRLVELTVRVGNVSDSSATFSYSTDAVRISADGSRISPEQFDAKTLGSGEHQNFVLVYSIKETLTEFDLLIDLGDELREHWVAVPGLDNLDSDDSFDSDDGLESDDEEFFDDEESFDDDEEFFDDEESFDDEEFFDDEESFHDHDHDDE